MGASDECVDVPDHPRQHQAALRITPASRERTAVEVRIGQDCLAHPSLKVFCADSLGAEAMAGSDARDRVVMVHCNAHHLAADCRRSRRPCAMPRPVSPARLAVHPVFHGQHGEVGTRNAVSGLRLLGPVEPLQPPRLFRLTTKNCWYRWVCRGSRCPTSRALLINAVKARRVMMAGQGVADQHGIARRGVRCCGGFHRSGRRRAANGRRPGPAVR